MKNQYGFKAISGLTVASAMFLSLGSAAYAQQATVEGMITGRSGPTMYVKTADTPRLTVTLSDSTKATEKGGFLGMSRKDLGITQLVPGLEVKVEGAYDTDHKLIAKKVTFSRGSLRTARQIDAGLNPVAMEVAAAQDQLRTDGKNIEMAQSDIEGNKKDIAGTRQDIATNAQLANDGLSANKQAIGQANNRFGKLDEYETKGSITVNFANGRSTVSAKDKDQLAEFVKTAADTPGAMIEVQGYASSTGSATVNQRLSAERATAVLSIIQQTGVVPLTRILAPAAMGTSSPAEEGKSRSAQAQNRRVVVTILVNKGING